jgi:protein O-mannosyl-transferase
VSASGTSGFLDPSGGPHQPSALEKSRWSETTLLALLLLFSILPYCNSLLNGFVYDDITQILDNPYILSFRYLSRIFSTPAWSYVGGMRLTNYYRPIMTFGYLLCFKVFGPNPYGFHLASILLHACVVLVLYRVTWKLFRNRASAFLAAGLFALHPIHTESVDWVAAVTDIEVTLFLLVTFWFFLRAANPDGKLSVWAVVGMIGTFLLALGSKEQALMLPPLALVYEHFYRDDRHSTRAWQKIAGYSPLWILAFAYFLFRIHVFGAFAPVSGHPALSRSEALHSGLALAGQYIWKLFWPMNLSAFYVFAPSKTLVDPRVFAGVAALAACVILFAFLWKRARIASFGVIWFLATLAPVLDARMLASDNVFAERYLYLPSIGFCWLVAFGCARLWDSLARRGGRVVMAGSLAVLALLYAARIVTRNRVWRDEFTLDTVTLESAPDAVVLYNNLGSVYWNRGQVDAAAGVWEKALTLAPRSATILNNLGLVSMKRQNLPGAIEYFDKAIAMEPDFPDSHLNIGVVYEAMGSAEKAEAQYRTAIGLAPLNLHAHNRLGSLFLRENRVPEAEKEFRTSTSIAPNVVAYDALGGILMRRGERREAEKMFAGSITLNPRDIAARLNLAKLYVADGRLAEGIREYQAVLGIDPQNGDARKALDDLAPKTRTHDKPH